MDSLKRALNRIFKRGKKNKQDQDKARRDSAAGTSSTAQAPQLPPITNASLLQGSSDESDMPVPSRRPLSTGKQPTPQEVVMQSDKAQSAPQMAIAVAEDTSVKPRESTPIEPAAEKKSAEVDASSALQTNDPLASEATNEGNATEGDTTAVADVNRPLGTPAKSGTGLSGEHTGS